MADVTKTAEYATVLMTIMEMRVTEPTALTIVMDTEHVLTMSVSAKTDTEVRKREEG